ncbi:MAG: DUF6259 domain-containing protein, partial [Phycisphaeraceae bacterium]
VIAFNHATNSVQHLKDTDRELTWLSAGSSLWQLDEPGQQLQATLTIEPSHSGEASLALSLHNPSDQAIKTDVTFPRLASMDAGDAAALRYCFPSQGLVLSDKPVRLEAQYSSRFPLQFLAADLPGQGGVYLLTCDTQLLAKRYAIEKAEALSMSATYTGVVVPAGKTVTLPQARIGVYAGDWREAFDAYRRWTKAWYKPDVPRKPWLREVFHFRQVFLYPNMDMTGLFDPKTKTLSIAASIKKDNALLGGVDHVHLFDWSQNPGHGRVGGYEPWHVLPRDTLNREINALQEMGLPVGLYFEGYLASKRAELPGRPADDWQLLRKDGKRYDQWGDGYDYMCPAAEGWRSYMTSTVKRVSQQTRADGLYIDQFGFGYQYPCYDPTHGHAIPSNQVKAEAEFMKRLRAALPVEQVLYSEQTPVDLALLHQDASFSYSLLHARNPHSPSRTNLTRFAFPDFKTIQILKGDLPIGEDVEGVKLVFYNGDGIWLAGPADNPKWFSPQVLEVLKKTLSIRNNYLDAFTTDDAAPIVPTLVEGVYANRFRGDRHTVWTLYNATEHSVDAAVLRVRHVEGATYRDAWNQTDLNPVIVDGWATFHQSIAPNDVGCIVMSR